MLFLKNDKFIYDGLYRDENKSLCIDDSKDHLEKISQLSEYIVPNIKLKLSNNYFDLYNKFLYMIKNKSFELKIDNAKKNIFIKDFLSNRKLNTDTVKFLNKKYKYNSLSLYNRILKGNSISNMLFEKIKVNIVIFYICCIFCEFINEQLGTLSKEFVIYDNLNNKKYKIVNLNKINYNFKEEKLMPPILPMRF